MVFKSPGSDPAVPDNWRESTAAGGNPGSSDALTFSGNPAADVDKDGLTVLMEYLLGTPDTVPNGPAVTLTTVPGGAQISCRMSLAADRVRVTPQRSADLANWNAGVEYFTPVASVSNGDGSVTKTWFSPRGAGARSYFRMVGTLVP